MPHYICVRFQVDGRIVVVHESWLVGEAHCRWPQSGNIEEMVKIGTKPKSEWGVWEIDILGGDDEYETCSRRAYSTQQSWGSHTKVQTYPENKDIPIPPVPTPQNVSADRSLMETEKDTASTTSRALLSHNPRKRKAPSDSELKATLKRLEQSISLINKNLSGRLKDIEDKLKPILNDSSTTSFNSGNRSPLITPSYSPKYDRNEKHERHCHTVRSPANTMEELDEWLDAQDTYAVAKRVSNVQLRATVRTFMKCVMTKALAKQFSWSGFGSRRLKTKTSFRDHKVFNYLIDVLHDTPHRRAPQSEVADSIKKVLMGVGDWDGGRTRKFASAAATSESFPTIAFFP
ncbi:uncharacterized protein LOC120337493 isoform X2 [Styela clava]|uniref:uncharacterized protein LOC120337493 isoform X2 n=1 Tax=Styela clava TaxID=7725 RepID=UPI0019395DB0|nr:uncharacterized protein LOC120337493 isoform X2 [Styela clava]